MKSEMKGKHVLCFVSDRAACILVFKTLFIAAPLSRPTVSPRVCFLFFL